MQKKIFLSLVASGYKEFLKGAEKSDQLSLNRDIIKNPSLTLSIQDVIMNNICEIESTLVINYDLKLRNFYQYVQQVEMESTGKSVDQNGKDFAKLKSKMKLFFFLHERESRLNKIVLK